MADVVAFDLPHWNGRGEVLHLMSFLSPLDRDLTLVYPRLAPVRLLELEPGSSVMAKGRSVIAGHPP